jgi:hypothetical protein
MTIPNKQFIDGMHKHQRDVFEAFDKQKARFFSLEWARRHRKTTLAINLLVRECCKFENAKYVYIAPTQVMARNIVWDDPTMLNNALPDKKEMGWKRNEQKMMVKFANGSILKIGGSDEPDSLRGIDSLGCCFDEWALIKENTWTEIFRPIIAGPVPQHLEGRGAFRWAMFLYTPKGINHATVMFDKACALHEGGVLPIAGKAAKMSDRWFASRLDGEIAGLMSKYELAMAKEDMPLAIYDQEIRCSRTTQEERTLITSVMLSGMDGIQWDYTRHSYPDKRRIISIDPAFGGDMCDLKAFENTRILEHQVLQPHLTNEIVLDAKLMAQNIGTKNFIVDCIGNGKGVADALQTDEAMYHVQYFNSAERPTDAPEVKGERKSIYANKRAQMAYYVAQEIKAGRVESINEAKGMTDVSRRELFRQIPMATRYKVNDAGQIILLPKDEIKKDLGCSPDSAESWEMGVYGLQFVDPVGSEQIKKESPGRGVYVPHYIGAR